MPIRTEVQQLVDLGPFPASKGWDQLDLERREALLIAIKPPLTHEEAVALLACFGPDDAFGLAWTLLHLIEATPGGAPIATRPEPSDNEWLRYLWDRAHR